MNLKIDQKYIGFLSNQAMCSEILSRAENVPALKGSVS
jgi:hypothetical protein